MLFRFGTFLCDTQKQRADQRLEERTTSLWTYVNCEQNQWEYTNPFYVPDMSVLHPDVSLFTLSLWKGYHLRYTFALLPLGTPAENQQKNPTTGQARPAPKSAQADTTIADPSTAKCA